VSPTLTDAVFPLAGTFICCYLLFQPKMATIAEVAASILGLLYGVICLVMGASGELV
jgi:phosphatidate cytidylyltransferase